MSDFLIQSLQHPFVWGLLLGLLVAAFLWKAGFSNSRVMKREIRRLEGEMRDLQSHLNTQLKINASGNDAMQSQLEALRTQNENLRVNCAALQQKPGRAEMRALKAQEIAICKLREEAPGFAAAWEKAMRQAEDELDSAESGLKKWIKRALPGVTSSTPTNRVIETSAEESNKDGEG